MIKPLAALAVFLFVIASLLFIACKQTTSDSTAAGLGVASFMIGLISVGTFVAALPYCRAHP